MYLLSWELINETTGRKSTQKGKIKKKSERTTTNMVQSFSRLTSCPPEI